MKIKVNKDIEKYDGGVFYGLSLRQCIYALIALLIGTGIVVGLSMKEVSLTVAVYIAMPVVFPIAYNGFYQKNGMTFFQVQKRKMKLLFGKRELLYQSTEDPDLYTEIFLKKKTTDKKKGRCRQ